MVVNREMPSIGVNKDLTVEFKRIIKNSLAINFHLYANEISGTSGTSSKNEIFASIFSKLYSPV